MSEDTQISEVEEVKEIIKKVLLLIEEVPEPYKQVSFGALLSSLLEERKTTKPSETEKGKEAHPLAPTPEFMLPMKVKAFLQKYGIPEEKLKSLFYMEGSEVQPIYAITEKKPATAQIQLALLSALESALLGKKFEFLIESVKEKCVKWKCYDSSNFKNTFNYNPKLFVKMSYEDPTELSAAGLDRLAKVITEIAK